MTKNLCGKTVKVENAYEVWATADGSWKWYVLKKWQNEENEATNEYARWFCFVTSPFVPEGEYGDTYVKEIKENAFKLK